ncbi:PAS domain S-box-containing protein [Deinococcus sp. HSC-46F16]|uniref:sensor histidine kinase n=1 Tax=Deinococcus sp. HSC-46F16 TaxID=2910968 RepID=UPI00209F2D9A|nr:ATP-binding protein [Deinococcus sp. HSC-46F16]MCP2014477.1 PAS domain S-box-containing protein [Deinococcus sp. HSC-46F16]
MSDEKTTDLQSHGRGPEGERLSWAQALTLFSEAPVPYLLLNSRGRVQEANAAACTLLGVGAEALRGRPVTRLLTPGTQGTFEWLLGQAEGVRGRVRAEGQLLHADGTVLDVLFDLAGPAPGSAPGPLRLVVTDITPYKEAHRSLLDQAATQDTQLQAGATRFRAAQQELEGVVTVVLRQLQLPVARAMNYLGLTRRALGESVPEEVARPLLQSERAVQQIIALLASVDRYLQMRRMRLGLRRVDLERVLREVLKHAQPVMEGRHVHVTHDPLPTVQGDSQALFVILDEYVANALKYSKGREIARIHVRVRETEGEYHIGVEDNGAGFNMRQKDRLFHLFGRLHPSRSYEGTGVGLVTVRRLCERFGGRVWAEGKPDQGATFWFAWPKSPTLLD